MTPGISKKEADAYDRMLDAAALLAELMESAGIDLDDYRREELSIFLAKNSHRVKEILKKCNIPGKRKNRNRDIRRFTEKNIQQI